MTERSYKQFIGGRSMDGSSGGMLAWAGTAVTVANAVPEAKRLASFVAPSCDVGGLADAVSWLMRDEHGLTPAL